MNNCRKIGISYGLLISKNFIVKILKLLIRSTSSKNAENIVGIEGKKNSM